MSCELTDPCTARAQGSPPFRRASHHMAQARLVQQDPSPQTTQTQAPAYRVLRSPSTVLLSHTPLCSVTQGVYGDPG